MHNSPFSMLTGSEQVDESPRPLRSTLHLHTTDYQFCVTARGTLKGGNSGPEPN